MWPGTWVRDAADVLQRDLKVVGIPYVIPGTNGPLFADFHALRHTYVSILDRSGVTLRQAQELARHSDVNLTMGRSAHIGLADLGAAVSRMNLPTSAQPMTRSRL